MMTSCTECAIKHLSTAAAYIREANNGYPDYRLWAIGELVQAEFELMDAHPEQAQRVRAERLLWRNSRLTLKEYNIPFMEMMKTLQDIGDTAIVVDMPPADTGMPISGVTQFPPAPDMQAYIDEMFKVSNQHTTAEPSELQKMYAEVEAQQWECSAEEAFAVLADSSVRQDLEQAAELHERSLEAKTSVSDKIFLGMAEREVSSPRSTHVRDRTS